MARARSLNANALRHVLAGTLKITRLTTANEHGTRLLDLILTLKCLNESNLCFRVNAITSKRELQLVAALF